MSNEHDISIDVAQRAAYELGRSLHFVRSWQTVLWRISLTPERPWKLEYPNTLFVRSFDESPHDAISRIKESLQTLVLRDRVDSAPLVELHRSLDVLFDDCQELARMSQQDDRDGIIELYWQSGSDFSFAEQFANLCVTPAKSVHFFSLGASVGQLVHWGCNHADVETALMLLRKVVTLLEKETSVRTLRKWLTRLENLSGETTELPTSRINQITTSILRIEKTLRRSDDGKSEQVEPLIVLDDLREYLLYLGTQIPLTAFASSRARGGLKFFRVLIRHPNTYLSATVLLEEADISCEPERIKEYISEFRKTIRMAFGNHMQKGCFSMLPEEYQRAAQSAFVLSDHREDPTKRGPHYKLALPAHLVRYIL